MEFLEFLLDGYGLSGGRAVGVCPLVHVPGSYGKFEFCHYHILLFAFAPAARFLIPPRSPSSLAVLQGVRLPPGDPCGAVDANEADDTKEGR